MPFIAIVVQAGEGCDYTIGCGLNWHTLKSTDRGSALDELRRLVVEEYTGDSTLKAAHLFEVTDSIDVPVSRWYQEEKERKAKEEQERRLAVERETYERLKAKFEA